MPQLRSVRERWQEFLGFAREVLARFGEDRVPLAAGAITFFVILSLVPVLLLVVSLAAFFFRGPAEASRMITNLAATWGPEITRALGSQVSKLVANRGLSLTISLVLGLLSGSQIFLILESAMSLTWRTRRKRPYGVRRVLALFMVLVVGLLLGLAVLLTNVVRLLSRVPLPPLFAYPQEIVLLKNAFVTFAVSFLIPTLLVAVIFAVIYMILPTRRVTLRSVLPGALLAAVLWEITLHLFGWYMTFAVRRFSVIYGSLSGIVLFMLWLYYSAQVFLFGAELSAVYHARLASQGDDDERKADAES